MSEPRPKSRRTLIEHLDAAAEATGIPQIAMGQVRRRQLRWWPAAALLLATAGMLLGLTRLQWSEAGFALMMFGFAIAVMLPIFGPVKPWGSPERVDEFDRAARARAFLVAFASVSVAAIVGIWLLAGLALLGKWSVLDLVLQLRSLGFYLMVLYSAVPTLHASWALSPIDDEG